jgi:LPXTG-motif cell wall-anchored protein
MKTSKIAAGGLGITLIAAMTLGGAVSSASAADFYVTTLGDEGTSYPEGWFTGTISIPAEEGTAEFTAYGLEITGKKQVLNGTPVATGLTQLANNTFTSSNNNAWYFQIPVFGDTANQTDYTTLVPVNQGYQNSVAQWRTTGAIRNADDTGNAYAAGSIATLEAFEDAFDAQTFAAYEILAYGYFWDTGAEDILYESEYNGIDTYYFYPQPTMAVTPNPVSITDYVTAAKGVTFTAGGVYPGAPVYFEITLPNGTTLPAGEVFDEDEDGVVTLAYYGPAGSAAGAYSVTWYYGFEEEHDEDGITAAYTVALAATGSEINPALFIGATSLLLAGAVLMIVRSRKATA